MWQAIRENPRAVVYAVLVHLVLLILLVFNLDWRSTPPPAGVTRKPVQAELVDVKELEAIERQKAEARRKVEEEARRKAEEKRKAEAEAKRKVEEKRKAEAEARQKVEQKRKAEAEARRKAEEKRKAEAEAKRKAEQKRKAEAEAKRKAEQKRKAEAEAKRKAEEKRKAEAEAKRKAEQKRKAEAELQAKLDAEIGAERERAAQGLVAEYTAYIREKVQRSWLRPGGSRKGLSCIVLVRLIPSGDVVGVTIVQGSGDAAFDRSVEAAVRKAQPLPLPPDSAIVSRYFRELRLVFKPD